MDDGTAYFAGTVSYGRKMLMTLATGVNLINLFSVVTEAAENLAKVFVAGNLFLKLIH